MLKKHVLNIKTIYKKTYSPGLRNSRYTDVEIYSKINRKKNPMVSMVRTPQVQSAERVETIKWRNRMILLGVYTAWKP